MRRPTDLYEVFCVYREMPDSLDTIHSFGVVDSPLMADILVGFLNIQTPTECTRLTRLAAWRMEHRPLRAIPLFATDHYAQAIMCQALGWLELRNAPARAA